MLGNAHLQVLSHKDGFRRGDANFNIHMKIASLPYVEHLRDDIYYCFPPGRLRPWPDPTNPKHAGKLIKTSKFTTRVSPTLTIFHMANDDEPATFYNTWFRETFGFSSPYT